MMFKIEISGFEGRELAEKCAELIKQTTAEMQLADVVAVTISECSYGANEMYEPV